MKHISRCLATSVVCAAFSVALPANHRAHAAPEPAGPTQASADLVTQGVEPIITDRPDFTESTQTVPRGRMQLEGGATVSRRGGGRDLTIGELLLRVPAGSRSELRFGINSYEVQRGGGVRTAGKDDVSIGAKFRLRDAETGTQLLAPRVSLIVATTVPSGARALREEKWQPGAKLLLGWDLTEKLGLSANLNYDYASDGGQRFHQVSASASLGYPLSERTGLFAEAFAFFPGSAGGRDEKFVNSGLTYLINDDFQLDARVGLGIDNGFGPDYFAGVGASRRF